MSRYRVKKRQHQINVRQKRKAKLGKLRQALSLAKTKEAKDKIVAKALKISPWLSKEEFLGSLKKEK